MSNIANSSKHLKMEVSLVRVKLLWTMSRMIWSTQKCCNVNFLGVEICKVFVKTVVFNYPGLVTVPGFEPLVHPQLSEFVPREVHREEIRDRLVRIWNVSARRFQTDFNADTKLGQFLVMGEVVIYCSAGDWGGGGVLRWGWWTKKILNPEWPVTEMSPVKPEEHTATSAGYVSKRSRRYFWGLLKLYLLTNSRLRPSSKLGHTASCKLRLERRQTECFDRQARRRLTSLLMQKSFEISDWSNQQSVKWIPQKEDFNLTSFSSWLDRACSWH